MGKYTLVDSTAAVKVANKHLAKGVGSELIAGLVLCIHAVQQVLHAKMTVELRFMLPKTVKNLQGRIGMIIHQFLSFEQGFLVLLSWSTSKEHAYNNTDTRYTLHLFTLVSFTFAKVYESIHFAK